jgi:hypothetical protein
MGRQSSRVDKDLEGREKVLRIEHPSRLYSVYNAPTFSTAKDNTALRLDSTQES